MKTTIVAATLMALGAGSAGVGALDMAGSDTLNAMTRGMISACSRTGSINSSEAALATA